ncbi:MAG: hypothetical protein GXO62_03790 [Epsilonproteobacteria bacterium]|nr:hypothetical protein [Campylobacterota bacterium]
MLIFWTYTAFDKKGFLEDEKGKFLPKNAITEALESAVVFYYIKKDKELENSVKSYLLKKPKLKEISKEIKKRVFEKYPLLDGIEIDEKIYLQKENISIQEVKAFDFEKKEFTKSFKTEMYKGVVQNINISSPHLQKLSTAAKSYARALAEYEHKELKHTKLENIITDIQNSIANEWELPLRIGYWSDTPYKGDLLFFWRIKEVREYLLKELNIDIRPKDVLYLPKTNELLGWGEIKENNE